MSAAMLIAILSADSLTESREVKESAVRVADSIASDLLANYPGSESVAG